MSRATTLVDLLAIRRMAAEGRTFREVSRATGMAESTVRRWAAKERIEFVSGRASLAARLGGLHPAVADAAAEKVRGLVASLKPPGNGR